MDNKIINMEEILALENSIILTDGSIRKDQRKKGNNLAWSIYKVQQFAGVNVEEIKEEIVTADYGIYLFSHPNVWAINEVANEIRQYCDILGGNIKYFNTKRICQRTGWGQEAKERLICLQAKVFQLWKSVRKSELNQNREIGFNAKQYTALSEMVRLISSTLRLKKDTSLLYFEHETDRSYESYTDEKLVAALFYLSLFTDKHPVIISADTDLVSLIGVTPRLIGADTFLPQNQFFREKLRANPFLFYLQGEGGSVLKIDSSAKEGIYFDKEFRLRGITNEQQDGIKKKIAELWETIESTRMQLTQV